MFIYISVCVRVFMLVNPLLYNKLLSIVKYKNDIRFKKNSFLLLLLWWDYFMFVLCTVTLICVHFLVSHRFTWYRNRQENVFQSKNVTSKWKYERVNGLTGWMKHIHHIKYIYIGIMFKLWIHWLPQSETTVTKTTTERNTDRLENFGPGYASTLTRKHAHTHT